MLNIIDGPWNPLMKVNEPGLPMSLFCSNCFIFVAICQVTCLGHQLGPWQLIYVKHLYTIIPFNEMRLYRNINWDYSPMTCTLQMAHTSHSTSQFQKHTQFHLFRVNIFSGSAGAELSWSSAIIFGIIFLSKIINVNKTQCDQLLHGRNPL